MTYGSTNNHVHNFHETSKGGTATSAPSSPLLSQRTGLSPLMPSKIYNRSATSTTKDKLLLSPLHPSATGFAVGSGAMKWNTAIVESEWERFISPFMNLVGVECLYARMEHVLDPERCNTQAPVTAKGGSRGATTNDRIDRKEKTSVFDRQEPNTSTSTHRNVHPPQLFPHPGANNDSSKLGSRRLIAIYRQIREDLIIVGEYLCDPVLGARVGDSTSSNTNNAVSSTLSTVAKLPLPPLVSGRIISPTDATRSKSLTLAPLSSSPSELQGDISKARSADMNYNERRELAAISFRETLDALIGFIDARCVLIRIHAVLCFQQKSLSHCISTTGEVGEDGSPMIMNNQISDAGRERRRKWSALAEQCQNALHPLSTLVTKDDDRCIPKLAVSNIEHEVKCLELVLTSIDRLLECE
ncbi:hypothetical protein ACHAWU_009147 [Discostella pseudostelligera]|uniref:Uncharacterized protein n=1 Tax=Discostella pseudostelligera TaxID=259834 RepID=A0ABD3N377_9STRA